MKRKIVNIDEERCNGCGLCVNACHEGALKLIDGKARLISDSYCDGLGDCLPECPANAITIEEREAEAYNEEEVKKNMDMAKKNNIEPFAHGCPGSRSRIIEKKAVSETKNTERAESQLRQWPCQIKLVPPNAPYFDNANLLIAADCTAYANANIHQDYMKNKITIIGCPKLDDTDYSEKLTQIIANNDIKSVTVLRMEVPCCGGIVNTTKNALIASGKMIPWQVVTIGTDGSVINE